MPFCLLCPSPCIRWVAQRMKLKHSSLTLDKVLTISLYKGAGKFDKIPSSPSSVRSTKNDDTANCHGIYNLSSRFHQIMSH